VIEGYVIPSSPAGRAAEYFAPPWHCAGDFLAVEFWASPDATAAALGHVLTPDQAAPGHAWALFADWQFAAQDDRPHRPPEQYHEFCILVDGMWRGTPVARRAHVYVDQASAMAHGWAQGYPRKLGAVSQTRSFTMAGRAAAALAYGTRLNASLSVCGQRQAEAALILREPIYDASQILRRLTVNLRYLPLFASEGRKDQPRVHELVTELAHDMRVANAWRAEAELRLPKAPHSKLDALAPLRVGRGYRWSMSCTVSDVRVLESFVEPA
jgi:acetoacetate decarboxylase